MNQFNTARRPLPAPRPASTAGSAEARKLAEALMDAMSALLGVIERETELVRAGQVREAMAFEGEKQELSRRYVGAVGQLKANQAELAKSAPELLSTLHRHHDAFRAMLQVNLTVLATAHAVAEGIIRGVSDEINRSAAPQVYGASGRQTVPPPRSAQPLAVSRVL
jgi:hypothetical protein